MSEGPPNPSLGICQGEHHEFIFSFFVLLVFCCSLLLHLLPTTQSRLLVTWGQMVYLLFPGISSQTKGDSEKLQVGEVSFWSNTNHRSVSSYPILGGSDSPTEGAITAHPISDTRMSYLDRGWFHIILFCFLSLVS